MTEPRHSGPGPMRCAPHIEGQYLRNRVAKIVRAGGDWFSGVYDLLQEHCIHKDCRGQFYAHAQAVEATKGAR